MRHGDAHKTIESVQRQIRAMGAEVFEVGLFKPDAKGRHPEMLPRVWDCESLLRSIGWLRHENREGRNIYIRPKGEHNLSLVDDLKAPAIAAMRRSGFRPAIVVETSPGNFQAWLKYPEPLNKELGTAAAKALAEKFSGDSGAADCDQFHSRSREAIADAPMTVLHRSAAGVLVGLAVSTGYPIGITASVLMPALVLRAESRGAVYESALSYYAGALWPLIPGAKNFFGPQVSPFIAFGLWSMAALLLALPWPLVWSKDVRHALWRAPVALALTVIPPLGIIGWASPLTAAGFLFPAMGWCGLLFCALLTGALAIWPKQAAMTGLCITFVANLMHAHEPPAPEGWKAINTHFGGIAHRTPNPVAEYHAAEEIQSQALSTKASVIVFPETVVPYWTASTDAFWQQTLAELKASGKTVLIGARIPASAPTANPVYDFSAELTALRSAPLLAPARLHESDQWSPAYFNGVVIRGAKSAIFEQRIPVPVAMWNPLRPDSAPLHPAGPGLIPVGGKRAAILICYEQLITWPMLTSMVRKPEILVAVSNEYWAVGTTIPIFQRSAVQAWARLFKIPYVMAVNT